MFKGERFYDKEEKATRIDMNEQEMFCNCVDDFIIKAYKLTINFSLVEVALCVHRFIKHTICFQILTEENHRIGDITLNEFEELTNRLFDKIFWNTYDRKGEELIFNFLRKIRNYSKSTITECYENRGYFGEFTIFAELNKDKCEY